MKKSPNIIFVLADQFRKRALEEEPVIHPNFDRFRQQSMWLDNAVSTIPVCSPYRGMMMTGQLPYVNGVITNCNTQTSGYGVYLKSNAVCWSDIMAENGYDLAYIGKWHLDPPEPKDVEFFEGYRKGVLWDSYTPESRRHSFNFWHSYGCCDSHLNPHYFHADAKVSEAIYPKKWSAEHETDVAIDYLKNENGERDENKPFTMVLSYNPPHPPFEFLPQKYRDTYANMKPEDLLVAPNFNTPPHAITPVLPSDNWELSYKWINDYFAGITAVDEQFGRLLDAIDELKLDGDTIVIFTSDHGELMGSHSIMHKSRFYNECFSVPLMVRQPGKIEAGSRNDTVVQTVDWMPTLLTLAGLEDKIPTNIHGTDMSDIFYENVQKDTFGLYVNSEQNIRGLKTRQYTYMVKKDYYGNETPLLFDDLNDPYQLDDIAKEHEDICSNLRIELEKMIQNSNDPWLGI